MTLTAVALDRFRHEAMFYAGKDEFLAQTVPFIREALAANEPVLVVVGAEKIGWLRAVLGEDAKGVHFADMASVGKNPARIIPALRDFVDRHAGDGRRLRGIGEPISPRRKPTELVECQRHEALLNLAFDDWPGFWLICLYDTGALPSAVIEAARRTHPFVTRDGTHAESDVLSILAGSMPPLAEPRVVQATRPFALSGLHAMRRVVSREAARVGLSMSVIADLVLAVNEVATNSVQHGGGSGILRIWQDSAGVVCEVRDGGHMNDPLADRRRPAPGQDGGRGLWLANQLCDLVQVRSLPTGTTVRLHMHRDRGR